MGQSTIIDIIGSAIIAGFLLILVSNLYGTVAQATYTSSSELTVQENLTALVELVESDFRLLGWCADPSKIADPTKSIISVGQHNIKFITDLNAAGVLDTLSYSLGDLASASSTVNPRDALLYRRVNSGQAMAYSLGISQFDFQYFDALGKPLTFPISNPKLVYTMQISIKLESPAAYDTIYNYAFWKQLRLISRNLRNR
jgi:hypothetical protein